ncbi:MAG: CoA-acylating methylmalonate-semialdehyde dehydrogenase [Sulfobacillus sp.]|nr:CoA-acylating methylmalonate-semialdehyde dehydrogenase [Sulfobacillus sp.]
MAHCIGGHRISPEATQFDPVFNPATGEIIAEVPINDFAAVNHAVRVAHEAQCAWADVPIFQRARVMMAWRDRLERYQQDLARLITQEHGKTLADALGEIKRGIEVVELAMSAPSLLQGEILKDVSRGIDTESVYEPLGVTAGITPFNFPGMIPLWMAPLAIVTGNAFILKPSERTPMTSIRLWELAHDAGVPDGIFNVVHGGKPVVDALLSHPDVRAISFVGSQPVAAYVYQTAAASGKRVQALGGAKNFHIVMPDAILSKTVEALMGSAFGAAGERCLAASVVIAVGEIADRLVSALQAAVQQWRVGNGWEDGVDQGPLIREQHRERVRHYIEQGIKEGAKLVKDGREGTWPTTGYFLGPTIFDQVQMNMTIAQEEIFGPVLSIMRAPDLETAVAMANQSRYGNTATIYTQSGAAARYFQRKIQAGMVGVNIGVAAPVGVFPFAGWKQSFYGDLHATGTDGLRFYTERRVTISRWWVDD